MFVTHMYLPSMWDGGKPRALYAQLKDFEHFEEWYRSELRGHLVQTLMQVNIQSLHVMLAEIDMHDKKAVRNTLVLFHPLDGNVRAEVGHHNTRYTKDLCQRYQDNFTASGPDEIARAVTKVMGEEDSKWREAVHAQTQLSRTNVEARVDKMQPWENEVQTDFKASMRFTTRNYYPKLDTDVKADSSGMFVLVCWGGSVMYVLILPVSFLTVSLLEPQSRGPIQMNS